MQPGTGNEPELAPTPSLDAVRARVEEALRAFLEGQRAEVAAIDPGAVPLLDELTRLISSGGKRLRPAFCYWGFRAAGGVDGEPIVRAAAALELLHTFALVHDDVMDASETRRGVPTTHVHLADLHRRRGLPGDPERFGLSAAILAGDLATVLADRLLLDSGFPPETVAAALRRYDRMRTEMAAGQFLDVGGAGAVDERLARRIASLKTGSYTVEGPLHIGATLAGGSPEVMAALARYGAPLGEAFQVRDDVLDAHEDQERRPGPVWATSELVNELVGEAVGALDPSVLDPQATEALRSLAEALALR
ncbi:MAG: polyprenyl synthetase family protein [Actinobacteria bacterium]|nr:polyprenyl synthetase family protein [Actinomycetota bacterium]